jgi:hypothetical protein
VQYAELDTNPFANLYQKPGVSTAIAQHRASHRNLAVQTGIDGLRHDTRSLVILIFNSDSTYASLSLGVHTLTRLIFVLPADHTLRARERRYPPATLAFFAGGADHKGNVPAGKSIGQGNGSPV